MLLNGSLPTPPKPTSIGHEATGEVIYVGPKAKGGFKVGDKIGFINAYGACFNCKGCACHYVYCSSPKFQMQGFAIDGFFQEYSIVDPSTAIVLPQGMDATKSAPVFCAGITAYHGVVRAGLQPGETLAVMGCGGLGQLAIRYAKALGLKVVAIDVDDKILALAKQAGVEHTFNSRSDPEYAEKIHKLTDGGVDAVAVYTAVKAGYEAAPKVVKLGGNLVVVGTPSEPIAFQPIEVAFSKIRILGASNHADPAELKACAEFTVKHGIESPSRFYKIDQIEEMVDSMLKHTTDGNRLAVIF